ncbi:mntH [Scenedesmus sp. PABB004]|nr:mntH [Scenedesmus sp. PABB004]
MMPAAPGAPAADADVVVEVADAGLPGWRSDPKSLSLPGAHASVPLPAAGAPRWRMALSYVGIGATVAVGYMDPGNWSTGLAGGARYGYALLCVVLASSAFAVLLQHLSLKLGVAAGRDLAQACRDAYPRWAVWPLWVLAEVGIAATDLAEVIGAAVALRLLTGMPLWAGVLITLGDVALLLLLEGRGFRWLEAFVMLLILFIFGCFVYELAAASPAWGDVAAGLLPRASLFTDPGQLFVAIGILGATVMPHNLYLHSAVIQTRAFPRTRAGRASAIRYGGVDSALSLGFAFVVNASILILSGAAFFYSAHPHRRGAAAARRQRGAAARRARAVPRPRPARARAHDAGAPRREGVDISDAYLLLSPTLGARAASIVFALALLAAGQNSTVTGTLAGQVVMEGFVHIRLRPAPRRLLTRSVAVVPAVVVAAVLGDHAVGQLLVVSQVVLSMTLPFAVWPLIHFTSAAKFCGPHANSRATTAVAAGVAGLITGLNAYLLVRARELAELSAAEDEERATREAAVRGLVAGAVAKAVAQVPPPRRSSRPHGAATPARAPCQLAARLTRGALARAAQAEHEAAQAAAAEELERRLVCGQAAKAAVAAVVAAQVRGGTARRAARRPAPGAAALTRALHRALRAQVHDARLAALGARLAAKDERLANLTEQRDGWRARSADLAAQAYDLRVMYDRRAVADAAAAEERAAREVAVRGLVAGAVAKAVAQAEHEAAQTAGAEELERRLVCGQVAKAAVAAVVAAQAQDTLSARLAAKDKRLADLTEQRDGWRARSADLAAQAYDLRVMYDRRAVADAAAAEERAAREVAVRGLVAGALAKAMAQLAARLTRGALARAAQAEHEAAQTAGAEELERRLVCGEVAKAAVAAVVAAQVQDTLSARLAAKDKRLADLTEQHNGWRVRGGERGLAGWQRPSACTRLPLPPPALRAHAARPPAAAEPQARSDDLAARADKLHALYERRAAADAAAAEERISAISTACAGAVRRMVDDTLDRKAARDAALARARASHEDCDSPRSAGSTGKLATGELAPAATHRAAGAAAMAACAGLATRAASKGRAAWAAASEQPGSPGTPAKRSSSESDCWFAGSGTWRAGLASRSSSGRRQSHSGGGHAGGVAPAQAAAAVAAASAAMVGA